MKRELRTIICPTCGRQFTTKGRTQQFCSFKCARVKGNGIKAEKVELSCPVCSKRFSIQKSDHRIKRGYTIYCSKECSTIATRTGKYKECPVCGKVFYTTRAKTCSRECAVEYRKQRCEHKPYFENGYVIEYQQGYNKKGNVKQHRRIMEEYLGRKLNHNEVVHHINGNRADNRIENLRLMTSGEHSSLHRREEKASGKHLFGGYHNN